MVCESWGKARRLRVCATGMAVKGYARRRDEGVEGGMSTEEVMSAGERFKRWKNGSWFALDYAGDVMWGRSGC